jgi:predicted MPP superfamily phosphohydrolase
MKRLFRSLRSRRAAFCGIILTAIWFAGWAFWLEPDSLTLKTQEIKIEDLPSAFENLKIAVVADIHGGSNFITAEKIRRIVEMTNAQEPDLIVLLGDFVARQHSGREKLKMPLEIVCENLRGLRARFGVFAVIGNHDLAYDEDQTKTELEKVGIRVLNAEAARIEKDGQTLILLGLPEVLKYNYWEKYSGDAKSALGKIGAANETIIALVHNPDVLPMVTGKFLISPSLRLILAAHTHGGQVRLPLLGSLIVPSSYGQKYAQGLIRDGGIQMFVSVGIGTSIIPVRFRVPPEIVVLNLN